MGSGLDGLASSSETRSSRRFLLLGPGSAGCPLESHHNLHTIRRYLARYWICSGG